MNRTLTGRLLAANPEMGDANFDRTVVFICAHGAEGAFGLVLNRPLAELRVADVLPRWAERVSGDPVFFRGGPVQPGVAVALARTAAEGQPSGFAEVVEGLGLLDLDQDPLSLDGLVAVRLYSGYSGWAAGQLDGEMRARAWFPVAARPEDPFGDPETLWRRVLEREGGNLALLARYPEERGLN